MNPQAERWIGLGAGVFAAICAALPWVTVITVFGSVSKNGLEGDGIITAGLGVLGGLLAVKGDKALIGTLICGVLVAGIGAYDWYDMTGRFGDVEADGFADASAGIGLYGTILAGCVLFAVGLSGLTRKPAQAAPLAPPAGPRYG